MRRPRILTEFRRLCENAAMNKVCAAIMVGAALSAMQHAGAQSVERLTMGEVVAQAPDTDWRNIEPSNLMRVQLTHGEVVIELAPQFAPAVIDNIRQLVADNFFASAAITRLQENYVAQFGDPQAGTENASPIGKASPNVAPEFFSAQSGDDFSPLDSRDAYAPEVGFVAGFPVGRDDERQWLLHCYAMVGVGRDNRPESGNGAEIYVVIGHAPRHLDRNVALIGRVIDGMEALTTLPRGSGPLGFYETAAEQVPIRSVTIGEAGDPSQFQALRTNSDSFRKLIDSRRYRTEEWFVDPAERIGVCNVPLPVRQLQSSSAEDNE